MSKKVGKRTRVGGWMVDDDDGDEDFFHWEFQDTLFLLMCNLIMLYLMQWRTRYWRVRTSGDEDIKYDKNRDAGLNEKWKKMEEKSTIYKYSTEMDMMKMVTDM